MIHKPIFANGLNHNEALLRKERYEQHDPNLHPCEYITYWSHTSRTCVGPQL